MGKKFVVSTGVSQPNTSPVSAGALPKFLFVYFDAAKAKGEVVQWSDTAGVLGYGVEDAVGHSTRVAGVVAQAATAAGWGWIQTTGYCDYVLTDGGVVAPNADTLQGDPFLAAIADHGGSNPGAQGRSAAEADGTAGYDLAVFAINLAADSGDAGDGSDTGYCILCCKVPGD